MTLFDHLEELRRRAVRSLLVFLTASVFFYPFAGSALDLLLRPAGKLVFTAPADAFVAFWTVVILGGAVVALPWALVECWLFIAAGLKTHEKKLAAAGILASLVLFGAGVVFGYEVMVPAAYQFLLSCATPRLVPMVTVDRYLGFVGSFTLAFGLAFQLPLLMTGLVRTGLVSVNIFRRERRWAIIAILVLAAILTPPDVVSQLVLALPMLLLYELGIAASGGYK